MYRRLVDKTADNNDVHGDAFRVNYGATVCEDIGLLETFLYSPKKRDDKICFAQYSCSLHVICHDFLNYFIVGGGTTGGSGGGSGGLTGLVGF